MSSVRVALDARSLQRRPPNGVARVTGQVLPHLIDRVDLELLTDSTLPPADLGLVEHPLRTPPPGVGPGWLQWSAARWLRRFDGVFHCPWYALPFRQHVPMVASMADLTFEHHPEWFGRASRVSYVVQARWAARTARSIITFSQHVADDIMSTYGVPTQRIFLATPAVDPIFSPALDTSEIYRRLGLTEPYVVAVGGASRRNLPAALAAWREVRQQSRVDLLVLGGEQLAPEEGLVVARLDDPDWAAALAGATALLYPTLYEGWGLPAVEAAASGTPVVCARVGSLPEVMGDAAVWCESTNADAVAAALRRLISSPGYAQEIAEAGLARMAAAPSAAHAAEVYYAAYKHAAS